MDFKNYEGKNVDDAITNACQELGIKLWKKAEADS